MVTMFNDGVNEDMTEAQMIKHIFFIEKCKCEKCIKYADFIKKCYEKRLGKTAKRDD